MMPQTLPARGDQCPPAALLEALSAGEPVRRELQLHLSECAACSGYVATLREEREAFVRARPPELFLRQLERRQVAPVAAPRRRWKVRLAWAAPLAACAAALAVLVIARPSPDPMRWKGSGLHVVCLRSGMALPEPLAPDGRVRPGDALRFAYGAPSDGYLLILEMDGTGRASVFHPWHGARGVLLQAESRDYLEGSVVLDGAPGPEWLVAVFSREPIDAEPLLRQLEAQAGAAEPRLACRGCRVSTLRLQKEP